MSRSELVFSTWNTRGLGARAKRNIVLREILEQRADVIFLQEVHAKLEECERGDSWLGPEFAPVFDIHLSRLCAILIKKNTFANIKVILSTERCIMLETTCLFEFRLENGLNAGRTMKLTCIYVPSKPVERKEFFVNNSIWSMIPDIEDERDHQTPRFDIVAGDFNDFPHVNDCQPPNLYDFTRNRHWSRWLNPMLDAKGIVDPLRDVVSIFSEPPEPGEISEKENLDPFFTRLQGRPPVQTRIDHILLSKTFGDMYEDLPSSYYAKKHTTISDHFQVFLHLKLPNQMDAPEIVQSARKWSLHPQWLQEKGSEFDIRVSGFMKLQSRPGVIKERLNNLESSYAWDRWRNYKQTILKYLKELTRTLPRSFVPGSDYAAQWENEGKKLKSIVDKGGLGTREYLEQNKRIKSLHDLVLIEERCRHNDKLNAIEQLPSTAMIKTNKKYASKKIIRALTDEAGVKQSSLNEMIGIAFRFYSKLYAKPKVDFHALQELMAGGRKNVLSKSQCKRIREAFTAEELYDAACKLNDKSVPGQDGLPTSFYTSYPLALLELAEYGTRILRNGEDFEPNTPQLTVTLIPKSGDLTMLGNHRPVSIINTSDRILSTTLATRMNVLKIAHKILPPNQTAYVSGRVIFDSILTVQLFISATILGLTRKIQVLIFLDQEKAFDQFAQEAISKSLREYGMPSEIIQWFKKVWKGAEARYKINDSLTERVAIFRGVLQGDPVSAIIYCMGAQRVLDYLSVQLVAFHYMSTISNGLERIDTPAYADDWAVTVSEETWPVFRRAMDLSYKAAGVRINTTKSSFMVLKQKGNKTGEPEWIQQLPYTREDESLDYRYLGGYIRSDGKEATTAHIKLIHASRVGMHVYQGLSTSWFGRVRLVNVFYLSKIWHHLGSAGGIDESKVLPALQANITEIIFGGKRAHIRLSTLAMPLEYGGLNLLLPQHMLIAMAGRDLARSLSKQTQSSELFKECMHAEAQKMKEDLSIWIERPPGIWKAKNKVFQPIWVRYAKAAEALSLSTCPVENTTRDILLSPWLSQQNFDTCPLTNCERKLMRTAGLRTWNDILNDKLPSEHMLLPLCQAMEKVDSLPHTIQDKPGQRLIISAWKLLHKKWSSLWLHLEKEWKEALMKISTESCPEKHWLQPPSFRNIQFPPHVRLAGVPAAQYTVHKGRQHQVEKEWQDEIIPRRHVKQDKVNRVGMVRTWSDQLFHLEERSEEALSESQETISQTQYQPQVGAFDLIVVRRNQAIDFFSILVKTKKRFKIPPNIYTSVYRAYRGGMPYLGTNYSDNKCCRGESASHAHKLFSCLRAQAIWKNMSEMAYKMGVGRPRLSKGECTELFPDWLTFSDCTAVQKNRFKEDKTSEKQLKMLLISVHVHALIKSMFKPVLKEREEIELCILDIDTMIYSFPYLQEQTEWNAQNAQRHARHTQQTQQAPDWEDDYDYNDDDDDENTTSIAGVREANGVMNFWDLW